MLDAQKRGDAVPRRASRSDRAIFEEDSEIARIADGMGFDSVWTIEHHFRSCTMLTHPPQYHTYIAGIIQRIDLGTMLNVLPWHDPVRVAKDVNMLDAFLGPDREIICGVGRGLGRREHDVLGVDQSEARERFDEAIQALRQLLATGTCDFVGAFYKVHGLRLRPQPDRDLSDNLWGAGGTEQFVQVIARHCVAPLTIPTTSLDAALANMRRPATLRGEAVFAPTLSAVDRHMAGGQSPTASASPRRCTPWSIEPALEPPEASSVAPFPRPRDL